MRSWMWLWILAACAGTSPEPVPDESGDEPEPEPENQAPSVDSVTLEPATATTDTVLGVRVETSDPEGDPVEFTVDWFVNGALAAEGSPTLDGAEAFRRGDAVHARVTPKDSFGVGQPLDSAELTVANSPPTDVEVRVVPENPTSTDDLRCEVTKAATDADTEDEVTTTVAWQVGGNPFGGPTTTTDNPGDTVLAADTTLDSWSCSATASDGTDSSAASPTSSVVTVSPTSSVVSIYITADDKIDEVYLDGTLITDEPSSWNSGVVYYAVTVPYEVELDTGEHVLAVKARDTGVVRSFMAAIVVGDEVVTYTGDGKSRLTESDPGAEWYEVGVADDLWDTPTVCSYIHGGWSSTSNGFYALNADYGAQWVWRGDTCDKGGRSYLWVRMHFETP